MKLLVLLAFLMPLAMAAQTADSYQQAMEKFQRFYNAGQGDSINAMYGREWDETKSTKAIWTNEKAADLLKEYGKLKSFKFVGVDKSDPNSVHVFQTVFTKKGAAATSLSLDKENSFSTFRLITDSDEISRLLKNPQVAGK